MPFGSCGRMLAVTLANWVVLLWLYRTSLIFMYATGLSPKQHVLGNWFDSAFCATEEGLKAENNRTTGLRLVLPSVGQTGTSSLKMALLQMGLKTFHVDESSVYATPLMWEDITPEILARVVSRCQLDALCLEPLLDLLPMVHDLSPEAKYVMTWRPFPEWQHSTHVGGAVKDLTWGATVMQIASSEAFVVPWSWAIDKVTGWLTEVRRRAPPISSSMWAYYHRVTYIKYFAPRHNVQNRGTFKIMGSEEGYLGSIDEIRRIVPPERLLEFQVGKHGWEDLGRFTGLPVPPPGTPFPRFRNKQLWTNDPHFQTPGIGRPALAILAVCHLFNMLIFIALFKVASAFYGRCRGCCCGRKSKAA